MSKRPNVVETTWEVAPPLFDYLTTHEGFERPERHASGIAYHRPGMHIVVSVHEGREPEVVTELEVPHDAGGEWRASLSAVYSEAGVGPMQDVPENARGNRLVRRRLEQHAAALRALFGSRSREDVQRAVRLSHGR